MENPLEFIKTGKNKVKRLKVILNTEETPVALRSSSFSK